MQSCDFGDRIFEFAHAKPARPARRQVFTNICLFPPAAFPIGEQQQLFVGEMSIQFPHHLSLSSAADKRASDLARELAILPT
ncbi:MAG TPA: hypothetical protein VMT05_07465, partial [Terriglobales bacterium]|nr:hypothetical protein [Terriglobales bacterium]